MQSKITFVRCTYYVILYTLYYIVVDTIRLFGGTTRNEGILEAFHSDHWLAVCSANWNSVASDAVCKQLGFSDHLSYTSSSTVVTSTFVSPEVNCIGQEAALVTCITSSRYCGTYQGIYLRCNLPGTYDALITYF